MSELRRIWRIATRGPSWAADDLSGSGSARSAGRWNSPGVPVVYASTTIALACLETVVPVADLPVRRWLPEERNVLIHPGHPDRSSLVAHVVRPWSYDNRLLVRPGADSDR